MTTTTEHKLTITEYKPEYNGEIMQLCQLFVKESLEEYGLTVTEQRLSQMIEICKGISFFLIDSGRPVGLIAGMPVQSLTNGNPALQEVIWYVNPNYRNRGHLLLQAFEQKAIDLGMDSIVMALMCNSMEERLDRIYRKLGYRRFEVQYIKELNNARA
jgi:GNAT superfamily N-acetyltransferase